jgi:hypothetical protein
MREERYAHHSNQKPKKLEEQHHNTQHAHALLSLALRGLLFELWG